MEYKLIEQIKYYPIVYDNKHEEFRNKVKKLHAWKQIADALGIRDETQCQMRWKSLRDRYVRENMNRLRDPIASNPVKWKYYKAMAFMKPYCRRRKTFGSIYDQYDCPSLTDENTVDMEDTSLCSDPLVFDETAEESDTFSKNESIEEKGEVEPATLSKLCGAVNDLVTIQKARTTSRNASFLDMLDGYLHQLPFNVQDSLKIDILCKVQRRIVEQQQFK